MIRDGSVIIWSFEDFGMHLYTYGLCDLECWSRNPVQAFLLWCVYRVVRL